jgi:hypothetical protein
MDRALEAEIGERILMVDHGKLSASGHKSSRAEKVGRIPFPFR